MQYARVEDCRLRIPDGRRIADQSSIYIVVSRNDIHTFVRAACNRNKLLDPCERARIFVRVGLECDISTDEDGSDRPQFRDAIPYVLNHPCSKGPVRVSVRARTLRFPKMNIGDVKN